MRGTEIQQFVKFPFDSSADMLMGAIHMAATGLASSHACFKLTVYTDHEKVAQSGVADIGLGDRVVIKKMPESMPENPYDNFQVLAHLEKPSPRFLPHSLSVSFLPHSLSVSFLPHSLSVSFSFHDSRIVSSMTLSFLLIKHYRNPFL